MERKTPILVISWSLLIVKQTPQSGLNCPIGSSVWALACSFLLLSCPIAVEAESLSPTEQRIADHVTARRTEAIELLETLVNINSGTLNLAGVREIGKRLDLEFQELGFSTDWVDGSSVARAGHLIAHRGNSGPHVLLIGHLDTVFASESDFQRFEWIDEQYAKGPGTTDMKGGDVIILEALRALDSVGALEQLEITVVLTGDEERSGRPLDISRKPLREAAIVADIALGFEDGDSNPKTAVVSRRGSSTWQLEVHGTPYHSSQIFTDAIGAGAIYEAARILEAFRTDLAQEKDLTYNPGLILGGTEVEYDSAQAKGTAYGKNNVIAEFTTVSGDLRALSPEQFDRATKIMQSIVAQNLNGTTATLTIEPGYPPMGSTDGNYKLLGLYSAVSEDLGYGPVTPVNPRDAGAADISFATEHVEMAIDGLGLMGSGGHTVDEVADMNTLVSQGQRAALLLYRLSQTGLDSD